MNYYDPNVVFVLKRIAYDLEGIYFGIGISFFVLIMILVAIIIQLGLNKRVKKNE